MQTQKKKNRSILKSSYSLYLWQRKYNLCNTIKFTSTLPLPPRSQLWLKFIKQYAPIFWLAQRKRVCYASGRTKANVRLFNLNRMEIRHNARYKNLIGIINNKR